MQMQMNQQRKITFFITISYTLVILYFMFFAFGRGDKADPTSPYTFIFLPDDFFRVPDLSDILHPTLMDLVGIGNIAAFIPFGILFPLLYRTSFVRFMTGFILSIFVLEIIQALTFLGSFDTNDVLKNSMGAAIGFGAYQIGFRTKNYWRNITATGIAGAVLMLGVWGVLGVVDQVFTKELAPFAAINEWEDSTGNRLTGTKQDRLMIGGQDMKPQYNVYGLEGKKKETYTYSLENKGELYLSLNYGIPDHKDFQGSLKVTVDGQELLSVSSEDQLHELDNRILHLTGANELKITLEGNETLWDVGYREMVYSWN